METAQVAALRDLDEQVTQRVYVPLEALVERKEAALELAP